MSNEHEIEKLKAKREIINKISPSFCSAKWLQTTLYLQNGYNHSCHHPAPHKIPVEEVKENPAALHNSQYKKQQRKKMLEGKRPKECSYCWKIEDLREDHFSDRHYKTADEWAWPRLEEVASSKPDDNINPAYLEVSFSNVCNFKCSYCSSEISSKWLEEIKQHGEYDTSTASHNLDWLKESGRFPYKHREENPYVEAFWKWFPEILSDLKVFRITGGEPLLSKDTWKVLDYVAESAPNPIDIAVNTNLCVDDTLIDKLIEKFEYLETKGHTCQVFTSLESTAAKAEYSRFGLDYYQWCKNVEKVLETSNLSVVVMTTVNILSITDFNRFIDLIMGFRIKYNLDSANNRIPISVNQMHWPPYLSIALLPDHLKHKYHDEIKNHCESWLKYHNNEKHARLYLEEWDQIQRLCESMLSSTATHQNYSDFRNYIVEYDKRRSTNFKNTFPELEDLLG